MITPSFNLTATERVLPKLALDFTTASLDPRVTFTRADNTATVFNSSGYVEVVNANIPRFDYNPSTLICNGLLIEEARTNLALQSASFASPWSPNNVAVVVTANNAVSPSGATTAAKVEKDAAGFRAITQQFTASLTSYAFSVFAKSGTNNFVTLLLSGNGGTTINARVGFNLSTQAITDFSSANLISSSITQYPNGWFRLNIVATLTATSQPVAFIYPDRYNSANAGFVYLWGAQIEPGAFATSYIPTTSTALTRNADVATMTGTNFSDWYNTGNGAFACVVLPKSTSGTKPVLQFDDTTALNTIAMQGNSTAAELKITTLAVLQSTLSTGAITANTQYGVCGAWSAGSDALSKSGASPTTGSPVAIPTVTQSRLGSDGTNYLNGWLQKINYWPQQIINAEVQAFSK